MTCILHRDFQPYYTFSSFTSLTQLSKGQSKTQSKPKAKAMDQGLSGPMGCEPPQSQSYHPSTPPILPSIPIHSLQHVDSIQNITPLEEVVEGDNSPYNQAYEFLEYCRNYWSSRYQAPSPWDEYIEKPFYIKISIMDWDRLRSHLRETEK
jgi:hypothetical protein